MINKLDLRRDIVPAVRKWIEQEQGVPVFCYQGRDSAGHKIYTHAEQHTGWFPEATVVYEGTEWAFDFVDAYGGSLPCDEDSTYELEATSSYEMAVKREDK